ncbi:GNAT family N-acetyltransferase [Phycisphaerales bacterium AB-hyl4]|uniref:GNAT family N-acetyltransferase n=1 Tax=Natronomicrosphaera hydrolytica TaxID=3242702 RepID=A0ABV4U890_9BACT
MAEAKIDIVGQNELPTVVRLYKDVFTPARDEAFFQRRLLGRHNPLVLLAFVDEQPVGFMVGLELKPNVFFEWLYGVLPTHRRAGIASQLMDAANAWANDHHYEYSRMECHTRNRPMLHMAIARGYDIIGIRWDNDRQSNLVIFEKELTIVA